ncbi:hypothetical protein G6F46_001162 [Rhizopus delemar]|uniref:Uncharacterized protein n=2 Tax=Rhizopus TaxID=4842 RepID=A0A9P6Z4U7_9FUNG|nr:hypothetical protein G6F55_005589 [Rhizopus delemar]KAG1544799.1 hypothetical protein G6F51_005841 [Rhizopus arrhizus]KAG1496506.1 hypothetical protein G6F54_006426 [Rhizopus delemar]KAG1512219.1 hypothetical protein G6F53_005346 [Rhizopus delemar]KAG1525423.1 hypothetical protein G6F52_003343 [Rhizopus delemar]
MYHEDLVLRHVSNQQPSVCQFDTRHWRLRNGIVGGVRLGVDVADVIRMMSRRGVLISCAELKIDEDQFFGP